MNPQRPPLTAVRLSSLDPQESARERSANGFWTRIPRYLLSACPTPTRKPRPGEVDGSAYYFVSQDQFELLIAEDTFIEHAEFSGNLYGTSKQTVINQMARGSIVLLDIDMEGVKQLKSEQPKPNCQINPRFVFIRPPSLDVVEARLRGRGTEDEGSVQRRLAQSRAELAYAETGVYDHIIVNDDLEKAFRELEDFVFSRC